MSPNTVETYVFLDKVEATIIGHECCNLLAVFDQLHTSALANSRVGLLGLNTTVCSEKNKSEGEDKSFALINTQLQCTMTALYNSPTHSVLHVHLFEHNALGVRGTCKWLFPLAAQVTLLVVLVCPPLVASMHAQLAASSHTTCLTVGGEVTQSGGAAMAAINIVSMPCATPPTRCMHPTICIGYSPTPPTQQSRCTVHTDAKQSKGMQAAWLLGTTRPPHALKQHINSQCK